jgi:glycosyltransferase involved in cell wall biosynthesis
MRVLLHDNQLCERGTTTALLDYARALRNRNPEVEISYWSDSPANVPALISRLEDEFVLHPHSSRFTPPSVADRFDSAYFIKSGENDGLIIPGIHNFVHAVFQKYEPHGSHYSYISHWLAEEMHRQVSHDVDRVGLRERGAEALRKGCRNAESFSHLDLIVDTPVPQSGMREELGIPEEAFVILRFGGRDTFDIGWAKQCVLDGLASHRDWYFVGLNTEPFTDHARARFVPMVFDPIEKASIIGAANVFLTARGQGEAFGVAIAEALQIGTPVLAWNGGTDRNHIAMLSGLGGLFRRPIDLRWRLRRLAQGKDPSSSAERRARGDHFRPAVVAPKFEAMITPQAREFE